MSKEPAELPPTVTHARLRATQGDRSGARRLLRALLLRRPRDGEARALLRALEDRPDRRSEAVNPPDLAPPQSVSAGDLAARFRAELSADRGEQRRFRIARLERWLARLQAARGPTDGL